MIIKIREAKPEDFRRLEEILEQNEMLTSPEIDGNKGMQRIYEINGRYFLVAEFEEKVVGMIRGCYDGSRAIIHQMVVDKNSQRQGIGKVMIKELASRFKFDGAPSISVTATPKTKRYYEFLGFSDLPITLMVGFDINKVIEKSETNYQK